MVVENRNSTQAVAVQSEKTAREAARAVFDWSQGETALGLLTTSH